MNSPEFLITKSTQQLFDLRKYKVMQVDEDDATVMFLKRSTFDEVYKDEEFTAIPARRFFKALLKVQQQQLADFTGLNIL